MNLRHTLEGMLFYVGIPTVTLYPLGFVGLGLQMRNDPFFPYSRLGTVWDALSLVPQMEVIGAGVWLLYLSLISLAVGVGVATLVVRVFLLLGGVLAEESDLAAAPGRRGWKVYLILLLPVAVLLLWNSVTVRGWHDLMPFIRFLVLSAVGGIVVGYMRLRGHRGHFHTSVAVAYVACVLGALSLATTQTPQLPLVEIEVDRGALHECSEVPEDNLFVMLEEADEYWFVYNEEGLFGLRKEETGDIRFLECAECLDRD